MSNILTMIKKELTRFFMDKKLVFTTVIMPGLMIYIIYSLMGSFMKEMVMPDEDHVYTVITENAPEEITSIFEAAKIKVNEITPEQEEKSKKDITNEKADLLVIFPENFMDLVIEYDAKIGEKAPELQIYYSSGTTASVEAQAMVIEVLDEFETSMSNKFDVITGEEYDLNEGVDFSDKITFAMIPMLLMTLITSGCVAIGPDFIAGEKERGTIATLLVTPMKRSALAVGKIISMLIIVTLCAVSSSIGLFLSLQKMTGFGDVLSVDKVSAPDYVYLFILILSSACVMIATVAVISAQANTVKEASTAVAPFNILIMVLSIGGGYLSGSTGFNELVFVPIFNSSRCMADLMMGAMKMKDMLISSSINIGYTIILMVVLTKMLSSEKIMFSK